MQFLSSLWCMFVGHNWLTDKSRRRCPRCNRREYKTAAGEWVKTTHV